MVEAGRKYGYFRDVLDRQGVVLPNCVLQLKDEKASCTSTCMRLSFLFGLLERRICKESFHAKVQMLLCQHFQRCGRFLHTQNQALDKALSIFYYRK